MAELLGYASVGGMLRTVSSEEISEWQAYFKLKMKYKEEQEVAARAKRSARDNNE